MLSAKPNPPPPPAPALVHKMVSKLFLTNKENNTFLHLPSPNPTTLDNQ